MVPDRVRSLKKEAVKFCERFDGDTGSPEVQISICSSRIRHLTEHLKMHAKDNSARRGLRIISSKRKGLLKYIKRTDNESYVKLLLKLKIRA